MIEVKFGHGDSNKPTLSWMMKDEWAHKLVKAFQSATNGQNITLSTPMGLFEFKHMKEDK